MPEVSVITPCYNSDAFIGTTIESVRAQTFTDWEHVIVDDGSRDRSVAVMSAYLPGSGSRSYSSPDGKLRLITQSNSGVASARNRGFQECSTKSKYLLFLDSDDVLEPDFIAVLVSYLDSHPLVGMLYCDPIFIDEHDQELDPEAHNIGWSPRCVPTQRGVRALTSGEPDTPFLSILGLTTIIPSLTMLRRSVYEQTPQWDETFGHIFEDADLFLQMALFSKVHHLPQRLARYRRHSTQSTSNAERYAAQEQKLLAKWRDPVGLTAEQSEIVANAWLFREGRLLPAQGVIAGYRHLCKGEVRQALRFYIGAARRYAAHYSNRPI